LVPAPPQNRTSGHAIAARTGTSARRRSITRGFWSHFGRATAPCIISQAATSLSDELRHQFTQVVFGYACSCDEEAARAGIKWLRERDREIGEIESLLWRRFAREHFPAAQCEAEEDGGR
jgi:hypothetical protein